MECKECKIMCDGKEVAVIKCTERGFSVECTEECKKMCGEFMKECCK